SPAFLPFLVFQFYREQGAGEAVRNAYVAFGDVGEEWLLRFMKDKGYEKEFALPTATGEVERKKVRDPQRFVSRAFELLSALGSGGAYGVALPFTRSDNEELRTASRALFFEHARAAVRFLLPKLKVAPEAQGLILEIEDKNPGTLSEFYRMLKISDPELEQLLQGEPPD